MTDQEIIQCLRENQYSPAMKGLYTYLPMVKKYIQKNNGSKQEAEDVFQEALIIFCNKLMQPHFELRCSINTYLYSVCKLLWLDELKKKNKQIKNDFLPLEDKYLLAEFNEAIEEDKPIKIAQEAIMKLGEKCKTLLQLFYFKKWTMAKIAVELGFKTEKVAKNQKYRCIEKAKENLKQLTL